MDEVAALAVEVAPRVAMAAVVGVAEESSPSSPKRLLALAPSEQKAEPVVGARTEAEETLAAAVGVVAVEVDSSIWCPTRLQPPL